MSKIKVLFLAVDEKSVESYVQRNEWGDNLDYEYLKTKKRAKEVLDAADIKKHTYVILTLAGWGNTPWAEEIVVGFRTKGFLVL